MCYIYLYTNIIFNTYMTTKYHRYIKTIIRTDK